MNLLTDEQTIDDLRIFGRHDAGGIYDLYNNTHTRGGEKVLEEMFRHPLSDKDAINRRSSIIESFAGRHTAFPFQGAMLDMTEKYILSMDKGSMRENRQQVLSEKDISQGVTAVIELIQRISSFMEQPQAKDNIAYQQERLAITALLNTTAFEPVHREKQKGKISYAAVAAYDLLFRNREIEKIKELLRYIYNLDVYLAVAKLASDRQFIFPKACDKGTAMLRLEGIYHPSLKDPVGNNIAMHAGRNVIFLTGANMAGKSTFLRALSTAMYIAHMGFPVAATAMEFSVMDGIYTTINLPDNLGIGASHFYAEVLRVKKVAAGLHARQSLFIVFDEMFRGTNVKDAHEATVEVTRAFAGNKNCLFLISSHIVEAGEQLEQEPGVGFLYLPTHMNGNTPEYTYTLEEGITADRHGMIIIRNEGILDTLKNGRKRAI